MKQRGKNNWSPKPKVCTEALTRKMPQKVKTGQKTCQKRPKGVKCCKNVLIKVESQWTIKEGSSDSKDLPGYGLYRYLVDTYTVSQTLESE